MNQPLPISPAVHSAKDLVAKELIGHDSILGVGIGEVDGQAGVVVHLERDNSVAKQKVDSLISTKIPHRFVVTGRVVSLASPTDGRSHFLRVADYWIQRISTALFHLKGR